MSTEVFISAEKIQARVRELAEMINRDFKGQDLVVIGVLNGAFMFCADLIRAINVPINLEFIKASSYGSGTKSSGTVKLSMEFAGSLKGKNILLVEDIVDTGLTIKKIFEDIKKEGPKTLKLASLLYKPARNEHYTPIDYLGFEIEDKFVIGYGLDLDGRYRELPFIGIYHGQN